MSEAKQYGFPLAGFENMGNEEAEVVQRRCVLKVHEVSSLLVFWHSLVLLPPIFTG